MKARRGLARLRAWLGRGEAEREMAREMDAHLALLAEDFERRGCEPAEARRRARLSFGGGDAAAEGHRETRGLPWLEQTLRDLRQAARSLRRAPAFTATAVLTLGLGLGATLAVFAVVNSVLLEPLPYPGAAGLVALRQFAPGAGSVANSGDGLPLSLSMYVTYSEHNRSFAAMGVWDAATATVTGRGPAEHVRTVEVSGGVMQALGVEPLAGRWLDRGDEDPHRAPGVVLSYGYWQSRFGGAAAVGRVLDVDGTPHTVVGVMPAGYRVEDQAAALILPIRFDRGGLKAAGFGYTGLARLRPGATAASADADLRRLVPLWMDSWRNCPKCDPHFYTRWRITPAVEPLRDAVTGPAAGTLWAILGTMALVMLIAAGNVTNLFLVRSEARQQELAVRAALGAGRGRLARQLLAESSVLAAAGCVLGLGLAQAAIAWLRQGGGIQLPRMGEIAMGGRVVALGVGITATAAAVAGLIPLWRRAAGDLAPALGSETRSSSGNRRRRRTRSALVVAQTALAVVLLIAAGLLLRTYAGLRAVRPGFAGPEQVETFRISVPPVPKLAPEAVTQLENRLAERLAAIPGVRTVGFSDQLPTANDPYDWDLVVKQGELRMPTTPPTRRFVYISPGYLAAVGSRIVAGRDFTWSDIYAGRAEVLISENLAREFWGGATAAVGQELSPSGPGNWYRVAGVVEDVRQAGLAEPAPAMVYWPTLVAGLWGVPQAARGDVAYVLRTPRAGSAPLAGEIRSAVAAVDPDLPVVALQTLGQVEARSLAVETFTTTTLALAGALALALGLVGIYGVVAYEAAQRRREIGIRLALGSSRGALQRMFVGQGVGLALAGGAAGLAVAAVLTRGLGAMLYGVSPLDPATFLAAPAVLLAAVAAASYLPARRAAATDPGVVLREG